MTEQSDESHQELPRWWIRNPANGVISAAILGAVAYWVTLSIKTPDSSAGPNLLYIVILPMALLLPALAVCGGFVAWHAFQQSSGRLRLLLAAPAAMALILNSMAVGLFIRWLVRVLGG